MSIWFYHRECQLGDYVFADGTFSDVNNRHKTVVGVCFYIDPNDRTHRLCVGINDLENMSWGLYRADGSSFGFEEIELADSPGYSIFDVPSLLNKTTGITDEYLTEESYRDISDAGDADGFKIQPAGTSIAELGWEELAARFGDFQPGMLLPIGLINTLKIIAHRNTILSDRNVNLKLPEKTENESEYSSLLRLINEIVASNDNQTKYRQYYYPAASLCHSYEPEVTANEKLVDCFKAGKWFLPSEGELARICWYHLKGYKVGDPFAIFARAVADGRMSPFRDNSEMYWSSTERTASQAWWVQFTEGRVYYGTSVYSYKSGSYYIRPIVAF